MRSATCIGGAYRNCGYYAMHKLKRKFEILALLMFAAIFLTGCIAAVLNAAQTKAATISETNWTSSIAPLVEITPTEPAPTTTVPPPKVDESPLYDVLLSDELQRFLFETCKGNGIPFEFTLALIGNESGYRPDIISMTNDYGLLQINLCNHEWLSQELGINDFLDPEENIVAGVYILSGLFERYQDPHMVLMAYNMGEAGAKRLWDKGVYQSKYSRTIIGKMDELQRKEANN